jgi:hypothetical protein
MKHRYPTAAELGIAAPAGLRSELFEAGFAHAIKGGHIDLPEHCRLSFRMGFRAGKICLRRVRRDRGIYEFPQRWRIRLATRWEE